MATDDTPLTHEHDHPHAHDRAHDHPHEHPHEHPTGLRDRLAHLVRPHSHDSADSVDDALEGSALGIRAVKLSLVALGVTAAVQALLVVVTGSVALLADTVHNASDALTAVPLWIAFVLARRRPDQRFTYGFGRAEDLAGAFVVAMIALSAVVSGVESVRRLLDPAPLQHPWVVVAAGVVGFAGNELVATYRIRVGRRIGSAALVADGLHARTDGFTSLAVVLGAVGVVLGFPLADPLVGLLITVAILVVLRGAARDVWRRLMDAVDPTLTQTAADTLGATPGVVGVDRLRLRWLGHRMTADADITVPGDLDLLTAHEICHAAEHRLVSRLPRLDDVTIHVSPAGVAQRSPGRGRPSGSNNAS